MDLEFRPSIEVDLQGLKRMAKEFLDALPTLDEDGRNNGFKAFSLAYLGCDDTELNLHQAAYLHQIVSREFFKYELADACSPVSVH